MKSCATIFPMSVYHFSGKIHWSGIPAESCAREREFHNGILEFELDNHGSMNADPPSYFRHPQSGVVCALLGSVNNLKALQAKFSLPGERDAEIIASLYSQKGRDGLGEIDGLFLFMIFDPGLQKCCFLQSEYGFPLPFYYTKDQKGFTFSTNLKWLLRRLPLEREFDVDGARDFLHHSTMIPGQKTLLKGIQKLVPDEYLEVEWASKNIRITPAVRKFGRVSQKLAREHLMPTIHRRLVALGKTLKDSQVWLTLTGGWDTNYILFTLANENKRSCVAITIDGRGRKNETPSAEKILKNYENVRHIKESVSLDLNRVLPELAWRYEGLLFEGGAFLRYDLGTIVSREGCRSLIFGTGADQNLYHRPLVMRLIKRIQEYITIKSYRGEELRLREFRFRRGSIKPSRRDKRNFEIEYLLKMHEILNNSFNIQGIYPFVGRDIGNLGRALGRKNRRKKIYISELKKILPAAITENIKKSGPVVETIELFRENRELIMRLFDREFAKNFLSSDQIEKITSDPESYHLLIIQLVYIRLFKEFFMSGRFDAEFDNPSPARKLDELFPESPLV